MAKEGIQRGDTRDTANFSPDYESEGSDPSSTARRGHGWKGIKVRFQSASQTTHVNANEGLLKQCEVLLKELMSEDSAGVFNTPVDQVKRNLPDYFDVVKNPMDLGTINSKLSSGEYTSHLDFLDDVKLTFTNAKTYSKHVLAIADKMSQSFESRWEAIEKKLTASASRNLERLDKTEIAKPLPASKAAKLSPRMQEPFQLKMTDEDKLKLSSDLESLEPGDIPDNIVDLLRAHSSVTREDEIEIDLDGLSNNTQFTLRGLLDDHLRQKQRSIANSEAYEIEVQKLSGHSNSSSQVKEENARMQMEAVAAEDGVKEAAAEAKRITKPDVNISTRIIKRQMGVYCSGEELTARVVRIQEDRKLNEEQRLWRVFRAVEIFIKGMEEQETVGSFLDRMMINRNPHYRRYTFYRRQRLRLETQFSGCDVVGWGVVALEARKDEVLAKIESKNF